MSELLQATGTLANVGDIVQIGGPDPNPALADSSTCTVELIGNIAKGGIAFEVSGGLPNAWYNAICWNKSTPNALQTTATDAGLYVVPIAACLGVRVRALPGFQGTVQVGMVAAGGYPVAYPGATIGP